MANTLRDTFSDIADAIRAKGVTGTMTPLEMPTKIGSISGGGGSKYGVPIDGLLADVDQNGQLGYPTEPFSFTSNDIRTIGQHALQYKFYGSGITSLSLPNLTQVNQYGMYFMCYGCSNLTSVNLPSLTTVGINGMQDTFRECTSLTSVDLSSLSSVTGGNGMYYAFYGCTSLTSVDLSSLSSVTGVSGMGNAFRECTALQEVKFNNATAIPAISSNTFQNTNSTFKIIVPNALYDDWKTATNWSSYANQIVKANPGLQFNATTAGSTIKMMAVGSPSPVSLKYSVNYGTFSTYTIGDTITLTNVGDNVIFVADTSGNATFSDDSSNYYKFVMTGSFSVKETPEYLLDESGELNAIPDYAFYGLFEDCTGLDNAPPLPNTSLGEYCYASMFKGCTGLTTAPDLPATTLATGCYNNMFYGCSSLNTIVIGYEGNFSTTYFDNWVNGVAASGYFNYKGNDTSNFGVSAIPTGWTVGFDYTSIPLTFTARTGGATISMAKQGSSAPNISLQYSTDNGTTWNTFTVGSTTVTLANIGDEVMLKATTTNNTTSDQYTTNFNKFVISGQVDVKGNCNSLLSSNFTSVTSVPLSGNGGLAGLFRGTTGVFDASNLMLPATTIGNFAYNAMFENCTDMTKAPEIFATTVGSRYGFGGLFNGCTNLTQIKIHYTGAFGGERTNNWVNGVAASGTFYYNGSDTTRGVSAIPTGWTITTFTTT